MAPSKEPEKDSAGIKSRQIAGDSRKEIRCAFISRPGGCQRIACPFFHPVFSEAQKAFQKDADEDDDDDGMTFVRSIAGATVHFNDFGDVLAIEFPSDHSCVYITGFVSATSVREIVEILLEIGFSIDENCVRLFGHPSQTATVKVQDPLFAKDMSAVLNKRRPDLNARIIHLHSRQTSWRKLRLSWHKATRTVWLNFSHGDVARSLARKYKDGTYKCLGHVITCSDAKFTVSHGHNRVPYTVVLSNVTGDATSKEVTRCIMSHGEKPQHVEVGNLSYQTSAAEVSVEVRKCLEKHGTIESFSFIPTNGGKREKAVAIFHEELDAKQAVAELNNATLACLGKGRLTATIVQSIKVKVPAPTYTVSKALLHENAKEWKQRHLAFHVYDDSTRSFTTLKVEGSNAKDVTMACRELKKILSGKVLMDGEKPLWGPALGVNGLTYQKMLSLVEDLNVVVFREKSKKQLRFHGPIEKIQQTVEGIRNMLKTELNFSHDIELNPQQFSWAVRGGFNNLQKLLNSNNTIFDVVSRKIVINGTSHQYDVAREAVHSLLSPEIQPLQDSQEHHGEDCPICFCKAEKPIQCSCKHTYCFECFEGYCESATPINQEEFKIKCCGSEGLCSTAFSLKELNHRLSSFAFERVLERSFSEHVNRRPCEFRSCPTPDCGQIYRPFNPESKLPRKKTCPSCFEQICTYCHALHGEYTCAEYNDIVSGGVEALEKLKRELNIKDCPKCKTPIEKTEGCNHMTCVGCKAHICWVCMDYFEAPRPCYDHLKEAHGGIGLGLEEFMFDLH